MPLVDNCDDLLSWSVSVESIEEISVFLVDNNFLLVWCKFLEVFHEPVDSRSVDALSVSFRANNVKSSVCIVMLSSPERVMQSSVAIPELADRIHSGFNLQSSKSDIIDLQTTKNNGHFEFICFFNSVFDFQTRNEWVEVTWEG